VRATGHPDERGGPASGAARPAQLPETHAFLAGLYHMGRIGEVGEAIGAAP
jgi:hypothetical protein